MRRLGDIGNGDTAWRQLRPWHWLLIATWIVLYGICLFATDTFDEHPWEYIAAIGVVTALILLVAPISGASSPGKSDHR